MVPPEDYLPVDCSQFYDDINIFHTSTLNESLVAHRVCVNQKANPSRRVRLDIGGEGMVQNTRHCLNR